MNWTDDVLDAVGGQPFPAGVAIRHLVQVVHRLEREIAENRQEIVDLRAELNAQSSTLKKRMR